MSLYTSVRRSTASLRHHHRQQYLNHCRYLSSILAPNSTTPLTTKQKTRSALSLLKSESNPETILSICRAASLSPESHLDRIAFSVAISKLSDSKYFAGISSYLSELLTSRPDLKTERFASHAIVLYGQAGMINDAVRTFEELPQLGIPRSFKALNALLFACLLSKEYKEVRRIFLEFPKKYGIECNLDSYNTVIKSFCESGSSSSAYSIIAEMERKRVTPNATSYGLMIAGFYKEEKFDDVGTVMNMMKKGGVEAGLSIYNIRIQSLCKLGRSGEAKALFIGMLNRGMKVNTVTYMHLIHGFCKEGNLDEAKKLFRGMKNSGLKPESDCYFTLIYFMCEGGEFEYALEVYKECMEKNWVPNFGTMKSLVNGLISIGKVDEAREIVGQMKNKFSKNVDLWNEVEAGFPQ